MIERSMLAYLREEHGRIVFRGKNWIVSEACGVIDNDAVLPVLCGRTKYYVSDFDLSQLNLHRFGNVIINLE